MKAIQHFKTIMHHKRLVMQGCFKVGLYLQGIVHDLSKFSPTEFIPGAKYFQGTRSPNNAEREDKGYSKAWMHHKGRNKHHYEYWTDYAPENAKDHRPGDIKAAPMPDKYIAEMIMDRIAASKTYLGDRYDDSCPLKYLDKVPLENRMIHPDTYKKLRMLLVMLAKKGEDETFRYIKHVFLKKR